MISSSNDLAIKFHDFTDKNGKIVREVKKNSLTTSEEPNEMTKRAI